MPHKSRSDLEPFSELAQFEIHECSVQRLDQDFCRENLVVVLGEPPSPQESTGADEPMPVGMVEPDDQALVRRVTRKLRCEIRPIRLNAYEVTQALDVGFGLEKRIARDGRIIELRPVSELTFKPDAPIMRILDEVLGRAVTLGASDIHFETYESDVDLRFRIDGVLHQITSPLSRGNITALISRLKVLADLDIADQRRSQDGRLRAGFVAADGSERLLDFRLAVVPGPHGEDAVLRVLDSAHSLVPLEQLGLAEDTLVTLRRLIENPEGLLLVCGPTASGKTTTLYSALADLATSAKKILTVEDPIEYYFAKINQKQVSAAMSFADYGRAFLRQNPDVILIGEIRDEETAEVALRAAQTGHLVLSTLHTNDAVRTVSRLDTLDIDRHLTGGSLLGALSQRLVRRLCPECRHEAAPSEDECLRLGLTQADGPFFVRQGCEACQHTGFKGRLGIFELFVMDAAMADLVADGAPMHRLRAAAEKRGMQTLVDDALVKARAGLTSLAEIMRTVPYRILRHRTLRGR